jgi:ABC-type enterochelin transport system substrate-binding protein
MNGASNGLDLAFTTLLAPATAQNILHQNIPNPVTASTMIRFELATAGAATLTVQDVAGRLILTRQLDGIAGLNMVELDNIKATGVLTYTLTSDDFVATRKMVVVR